MYNYLIYILVIYRSFCKFQQPEIKIYNESLGQDSFILSTKEKQIIRFEGAFDVLLYKKDGIDDFKNISSFSIQDQNSSVLGYSGCEFDQRRTKIFEDLWSDIPSQDIFFTDLIIVKEFQSLILLRYDFQLLILNYELSKAGKLIKITGAENLFSFRDPGLDESQKGNKSMGYYDQMTQTVFIFNGNSCVFFKFSLYSLNYNYNRSIKNQKENLNFTKFDLQNHRSIKKIKTHLNYLFIISDEGTIDVYLKSENEFKFIYSIIHMDENDLELYLLDIVISQKDMEYTIAVLDSVEGIHFLNISTESYSFLEHYIPIQNAIAFVSYKGSFLVAAMTNKKINFAVEILYDLNSYDYYYNKFYLDVGAVKDLYQIEDKAIIMGYDAQKLVYLNIYQGFTDHEFEWGAEFIESHVESIRVLNTFSSKYALLLTKNRLKTYRIEEEVPQLICASEDIIKESYYVKINSTICSSKTSSSPFELCQLDYMITLQTVDVLVDSDQKIYLIISGIAIGIILLSTVVCLFYCSYRWSIILSLMERQRLGLEQKQKYNEMQEQKTISEDQIGTE